MIGESAVVVTAKTGRAKACYQSEICQAESERPLCPGQQVMKGGVEGLTLQVTEVS
jgi:membrane-bound ClpP family serine protease